MNEAVSPGALSTLFTDARTHNGWRETPVSDETLREIYALMKWGPTSANCSPARIVFIRTAEGKERLRPALSSGNLQKTLTAPVTAIVAWDSEFYERLPQLFPHGDARSWFTSSPQLAEETAFRNSSMQAAYLIVACRALGLDTGPMLSFARTPVADKTAGGLTAELAEIGAQLMVGTLTDLPLLHPVAQDDAEATYAAKIDKAESRIDWAQDAAAVERQVRAFAPAPGAFFEHEGERYRVLAAEMVEGSGTPGEVIDGTLTIACGTGAIRPVTIQRAGKPAMETAALLRGKAIAAGTVLA